MRRSKLPVRHICRRAAVILNLGGLTAFVSHNLADSRERRTLLSPRHEVQSAGPATINVPGTSSYAHAMLPIRTALFIGAFNVAYPILLVSSALRALYLRARIGLPSQILAKGAHGSTHVPDQHYSCQVLFNQPLDEDRLRQVLIRLCAEGDIDESEVCVRATQSRHMLVWYWTCLLPVFTRLHSYPRLCLL